MGDAWTDERARTTLRKIFDAAIASAAPDAAVRRACAAMAAALNAAWPDVALSGVVATRYGRAVPAGRIRIIEAGHPVPDVESERAARAMLHAVGNLRSDDLVIALVSGGGSALLTLPAGSMSLADKQAVNKALLLSGATIGEMNAVRKRLSAIKGGRLAATAKPARPITLVISDVPGDDPGFIASAPTVPDSSTLADVAEIVMRFRLALPASAEDLLATGSVTPKPGEIAGDVRIIMAPSLALAAAAETARRAELASLILGDALEGESRELGTIMAGIARSVRTHGLPARQSYFRETRRQ